MSTESSKPSEAPTAEEDHRLTAERKRKLARLTDLGVAPYGERLDDIDSVTAVRERAAPLDLQPGQTADDQRARVAGRIVLQRVMGNLVFLTVRDGTGDLQFGLSKKALPEAWPAIKLLDLGDLVAADGVIGRTKMGELTLWADRLRVMCKALRQPPAKWHGLTDVELRYRQRYVDLFANPDAREVFRQRSTIIQAIREYLLQHDYCEVETPVLQPIYGGAAAKPFTTHHHTLDAELFLRISPELYLKRLLVGGMERVFEFSRNFRNEGIGPFHSPEFTMLELYEAYADYRVMMERVEQMTDAAIERIGGGHRRRFGEHELDFAIPWRRAKYGDLLREHAGVEMGDREAVLAKAHETGVYQEFIKKQRDDPLAKVLKRATGDIDHAVLVSELFEAFVEPTLIQPTFVHDYPAALCPLTRRHPEDETIALRFEAFIAGVEMGNAYTELNDPQVQEANFRRQVAGQDQTMAVMDRDFLRALEYGMPPAGGLGVGIDRLVMVLTDRSNIRDVILFPLLRPEAES